LRSSCPDDPATIEATAARYGLTRRRLERWLAELSEAVTRQDRTFRSWVRLARCSDDVFKYRKQAISTRSLAANEQISHWPIRTLFDFEKPDYEGWTVAGAAFSPGPDHSHPSGVHGYVGDGFANSYAASDAFTGKLLSPRFNVDRPNLMLGFFIAGGNHPDTTCVNLIVHSQAMHQSAGCMVTGGNSDLFELRFISLIPFVNRQCAVELVDEEQGAWGHIMADHFFLYELPSSEAENDIDGQGLGDNELVVELLLNPRTANHAALAAGYQQAIVGALTTWQAEIEQYLAGCASQGQEPEAIRFVRQNLTYEARDELLAWALRSDSLLGDYQEAEKFLTADERQRLTALRQRRRQIESQIEPSAIAMVARDVGSEDAQIQIRGDSHRLGARVPRGYLVVVCGNRRPAVKQGSGRLELAQWMAAPTNPLTARVMVNRIWQHHFGQGLVATVDDFGTRGEPPSHPELLDYLARRFIESGWSIKAMHRLLLLSSVYQQSSRASETARQRDPDNKLLSHMPVRRLEAECIRDAMLAVSGDLDRKMYGPSISLKPPSDERREYIPPTHSTAERSPRRTIYLEVRRAHIPELLLLFDFPKPVSCVGRRPISIVPLQSLNLLNDGFVVQQAKSWGTKMAAQAGTPAERVARIYTTAFSREPSEAESAEALAFLAQQQARHAAAQAKDPEKMAWIDLCHLTFNLSEFIFAR
jgi:hypothetical protein